jgi:hypothetical protein
MQLVGAPRVGVASSPSGSNSRKSGSPTFLSTLIRRQVVERGAVAAGRLNRFPSNAIPSGKNSSSSRCLKSSDACTRRSDARGRVRSANARMPCSSSSSTASVRLLDIGERQLLAQLVALPAVAGQVDRLRVPERFVEPVELLLDRLDPGVPAPLSARSFRHAAAPKHGGASVPSAASHTRGSKRRRLSR